MTFSFRKLLYISIKDPIGFLERPLLSRCPFPPISFRRHNTDKQLPVSCFYQTGTSGSTAQKVLNVYQTTYTSSANKQCGTLCNNQLFNFYGVVNTGTGNNVDCYCGDTLNYVTILNLGSGLAPDNNCGLCNGGPAPAGECGIYSSSTVAIFARAF